MNQIPGTKQDTHEVLTRLWADLPGWRSLCSVNHTTLGLRFIYTGMMFFLIGGVLAMLIRTQLALPGHDLVDADVYAQLFSMHGTVMMFLFAIPVLEGLAIYLMPKMMGVRDMLYPRLTSLGYYCYLFGGLILLSSLALDMAPDSGWFMYTPLSSEYAGRGSDFWLLGVTFVEISAVAAGVELTVSILRSRAPGMGLMSMPILAWYFLGMAVMILLGFPPLILASILLELERAAGLPFFAVAKGGDPLLWQHLFWIFGHPEVYIIFLPGAGIVSTLIPVFARRPLIAYSWVVVSVGAVVFLSFALWVHHMFTVGIPHVAQAFFSVASMLIAIPTAVQIFAWLATLWQGERSSGSIPMLWIFGFLVIFMLGGLTGVMLALVPFNWQVHDTHFVVAHMHYVLVGGMLFPLMAGLYYWLPHFSGRLGPQRLGRWGFWLTFIGFNGTFFHMHLTGLLGMPRRLFTYSADSGWAALNLFSSVSGFVMAAGIAAVLLDLLLHARYGKPAPQNPWQADTLEWATTTPPALYNFVSLPRRVSANPLWSEPHLAETLAAGEGWLSEPEARNRETISCSLLEGELQSRVVLPTNSWLPMMLAGVLALLCISLLVRAYPLAIFAAVVAGGLTFYWSWRNGPRRQGPGPERELRAHWDTLAGPGLWGMQASLVADASLFFSWLFSWGYLWFLAPEWSLPAAPPFSLAPTLFAVLTGVVAWLAWERLTGRAQSAWLRAQSADHPPASVDAAEQARARQEAADGSPPRAAAGLPAIAALLALLHGLALIWLLASAEIAPRQTTHDAMVFFWLAYALLHAGLVAVSVVLQWLRWRRGWVGPHRPYELGVVRSLARYHIATLLLGALVVLPASFA